MSGPATAAPATSIAPEPAPRLTWPDEPGHIPSWVYTDERIYEREKDKIFRGRTWNYVGLEAEVPNPGDFVRSYVGPYPVLLARDHSGALRVVENRCAHRGVEFCKSYRGNAKQFVCPYHQWSYELDGRLTGVPFRRGINGKGGMPASFKLEDNGLRALNVAVRGGIVFASFRDDVEPLEDYLGPDTVNAYDTVFDGRPLTVLGQHRNTLPCNWKSYQENLKDPYHATLLHVYFTTFGLFVAGNKTLIGIDEEGRHHSSLQERPKERPKLNETTAEIASFRQGMTLHDPRVVEYIKDNDTPWNATAITVWPNLVIVRNMNIMGVRQIVPNGPDESFLIWTQFGYADDTPEITKARLLQNNLFGPAGYVGVDDHEVLKFSQDGQRRAVPRDHVVQLGGDETRIDAPLSELPIRSMYAHYRKVMEL